METHIDEQEVLAIIHRHDPDCGGVIAMLEDIQTIYGYLPEKSLRLVAQTAHRSLVDVYGVATFYKSFSLRPRGRHHLCVCMGTACHVRNAPMISEEFERQLGITAGETTPDGEFTLEKVSCLGACALGPIVVADGVYHSKVDSAGVSRILRSLRRESKPETIKPSAVASAV